MTNLTKKQSRDGFILCTIFTLMVWGLNTTMSASEAGSDFQARFFKNIVRREISSARQDKTARRSILCLPFTENEAPVIDGKLDDPAWKDKNRYLGEFVTLTGARTLAKTEAWVGRTKTHLIIAVRCHEPEPEKIVARTPPARRDNDELWKEDCIEIFLDTNNDQTNYYQIIVNSLGAVADLKSGVKELQIPDSWEVNLGTEVATSKGKDFWALEIAISLKDLGMTDLPGYIGFNIGREKQTPPSELQVWSPGAYGSCPQEYGRLILRQATVEANNVDPGEVLVGENKFTAQIRNPQTQSQTVTLRLFLESDEKKREIGEKSFEIKGNQTQPVTYNYTIPEEFARKSVVLKYEFLQPGDGSSRLIILSGQEKLWIPAPIHFFWERAMYYSFESRLRGIVLVNMSPPVLKGNRLRFTIFDSNKKKILEKTSDILSGELRGWVFDLKADQVNPGEYTGCVELLDQQGKPIQKAEAPVARVKTPATMEVPEVEKVPLKIVDDVPGDKKAAPLTLGVPFPQGTLRDAAMVRVVDGRDKEIPCQTETAAFWDEGGSSIRWLLVDMQADISSNTPAQYTLQFGRRVKRRSCEGIRVVTNATAITVDTGVLQVEFVKGSGNLIDKAWLDLDHNHRYDNDEIVLKSGAGQYLIDNRGEKFIANAEGAEFSTTIETAGPLHTVVCRRGWYKNNDKKICQYVARLHFFRDKADVKLAHTFIFTEDSNQTWLKDLALVLSSGVQSAKSTITFGIGSASMPDEKTGSMAVESTGGTDNVYMLQDKFKHFVQPECHFGIYRIADGKTVPLREGKTAGNWFDMSDRKMGLSAAVRDLPRLFPKELEVKNGEMVIHLWSSRAGQEMDFRLPALVKFWGEEFLKDNPEVMAHPSQARGMARSHDIYFRFHSGTAQEAGSQQFGALADTPILAMADPAWNGRSGVVGNIHPEDRKNFPEIEALMDRLIDKLLFTVEDWDNGFFDYGGGPHNAYIWDAKKKQLHVKLYRYNNRDYNYYYGLWLDYLRSGDRRYFRHAERYIRYRGDVTMSHIDHPEKIIGSIASATPVHWGGTRSRDIYPADPFIAKSDSADAYFLYYYLTGDRRGLEIAADIVQGALQTINYNAFVRDFGEYAQMDRDTFGIIREFLALYRVFWDERLLVLADDAASHLIDLSKPAGVLTRTRGRGGVIAEGPAVSHIWAKIQPLTDFAEFSRRPDVLESARRLIRYSAQATDGFYPLDYGGRWAFVRAYGYQLTKDPIYAAQTKQLLNNAVKQGAHGTYADAVNILPYLNDCSGLPSWTIDIPFALATVADCKEELPIFPFVPMTSGPDFWFCKSDKAPIEFGVIIGVDQKYNPPVPQLTDPDGKTITPEAVRIYPFYVGGEITYYEVKLPGSAKQGTYRLQVGNPFAITYPSANLTKAVCSIENGLIIDNRKAQLKWYVYVPKDSREIGLDTDTLDRFVFQDPDGNPVEPVADPVQGIKITVPEKQAGKFWSIHVPGTVKRGTVKISGVSPFAVYGDKSRYFEPIAHAVIKVPAPYSGYNPETIYAKGVSSSPIDKSLQVNGKDVLRVPRGKALGREGEYEFLDCREGTIEFWALPHLSNYGLGKQQTIYMVMPLMADGTQAGGRLPTRCFLSHIQLETVARKIYWRWPEKGMALVTVPLQDPLVQGQWSHFAFEWNTEGQTLRRTVYCNGRAVKTSFEKRGSLLTEMTEQLGILATPGYPFVGCIDELRISSKVRYQGETYALDKARRFEPDANTLLLYHFDGDTAGTTVNGKAAPNAILENR